MVGGASPASGLCNFHACPWIVHAVRPSLLKVFVGEEYFNRKINKDGDPKNHANEMTVDMFRAQKVPTSPHLV